MKEIIIPLLLFLGVILFTSELNAQKLEVGDQLSTLALGEYLQAPKDHYRYDDLKDRALVLEFWATWCAPCIKLMPHLNALSKQFEKEPIHFISITDENSSTVNHFLERHTINGWIGLDENRSVHEKFGIYAIPKTVLITPLGRVAAITRADEINAEILEKLIKGDSIAIQSEKVTATIADQPKSDDNTPQSESLLDISISKTDKQAGSSTTNTSKGIYSASSIPVKAILQKAYHYSSSRIIAPDSILNTRLNVSIKAPGTKGDELYTILQNALQNALRVEIKEETRNKEVYVLSAPKGVTNGLRIHTSNIMRTSTDDGVIAASGSPISVLKDQMEQVLEVPIVNMTDFQESYAWTVTFDGDKPTSLVNSVREQLGLNLKLERRDIEMLIVTSK